MSQAAWLEINLIKLRKALLFCIENLNKGDTFNIIRFSTEAEALFDKLVKVSDKTIQKAKQFIQDLKAMGGTNIEEALQLALQSVTSSSRPHFIIFITDGMPTVGETDEKSLIEKIKNLNHNQTRIFTFGVGDDVNTHLLDKITELSKAYRTYIGTDEDIEIKISQFYQKIQSPILTDLHLTFSDNIKISQIYPHDLPDLFSGSSLSLLGRFEGQGEATVTLKGKIKNQNKEYSYKIDFSQTQQNNDFIVALWAARRIGYLLDQIRLHGENKEIVDEITQLARQYGIITPYTSFLILEDEDNRVPEMKLKIKTRH